MHSTKILTVAFCLFSAQLAGSPSPAQENPPQASAQAQAQAAQMAAFMESLTPGPPHAYLATFTGTWKATFWSYSSPGAEPTVATGTLERTMVMGGRVLQETIDASFAGLPYQATGHIGFDNVTDTYWATSFDSLSTGLTVLKGVIDTSSGKATFKGLTPEPVQGRAVPMRLEIYWEGEGRQVTESYFGTSDGGEALVIKTLYERQ